MAEVVKIILEIPETGKVFVDELDSWRDYMGKGAGIVIPRADALSLLANLGMTVASLSVGGPAEDIADTVAKIIDDWKGLDAEHTPEG